jgi:hypothetical protein
MDRPEKEPAATKISRVSFPLLLKTYSLQFPENSFFGGKMFFWADFLLRSNVHFLKISMKRRISTYEKKKVLIS